MRIKPLIEDRLFVLISNSACYYWLVSLILEVIFTTEQKPLNDFFYQILFISTSTSTNLKFVKLFFLSWWLGVFDNVKSDGFREWSALASSDNIASFDITETWGQMDSHVLKFNVSSLT